MSILTAVDLTRKVGELKADLSAPPSVTLDNDRKPILAVSNLSKAFGKVTAVDAINFEVFEREIFGPVGITATAPTYSSAIALANRIKQSNNDTKVVLGGPQATFLDRSFLARAIAKKRMGFVLSPVKASVTDALRSILS
jgi:ABC-type phosphonate transport system ATPase subunit